MSRVSQFLRQHYHGFKSRLTQIRDTPHSIAGGVAIGVLFAFSPLLGLKTLLAILVAWLFRCSKLSAALAVALHDVLIPLGPFILRWQYQIGYYLVSHPHRLPARLIRNPLKLDALMDWRTLSGKTLHLFVPTLVGSVVIGAPIAAIMYCVVLEVVKRARAPRAHAHPEAASADTPLATDDSAGRIRVQGKESRGSGIPPILPPF